MRQQQKQQAIDEPSEEPVSENDNDDGEEAPQPSAAVVLVLPASSPRLLSDDVADFLELARKDFPTVVAMVQESSRGGVTLQVGQMSIPDANLSTVDAGRALLEDLNRLESCLKLETEHSLVEQWGLLAKWWRIVRLAYTMVGIFAFLRSHKKKKGAKKIQERYAGYVNRVKHVKALSYTQAMKYDRLGQFLLRFPRFAFQLQRVTLADWMQEIEGAVLMEVVERGLEGRFGRILHLLLTMCLLLLLLSLWMGLTMKMC